jgi:hypothetical protein
VQHCLVGSEMCIRDRSCGNQNSTEVKTEDTTMVADSTMTLDSTSMVVDSAVTESK